MWVHPHDVKAQQLLDGRVLSHGRVIYEEAAAGIGAIFVEDEEAIAGGLQVEDPIKQGKGWSWVPGDHGLVVEDDDIFADFLAVFLAGDDGEVGLVAVVGQEEFTGGGDAQPGAAAEEGCWGEADENLPFQPRSILQVR